MDNLDMKPFYATILFPSFYTDKQTCHDFTISYSFFCLTQIPMWCEINLDITSYIIYITNITRLATCLIAG